MYFDFATADRIIFGPGKITEIQSVVNNLGKKAFIIHSKSQLFVSRLAGYLEECDIEWQDFTVPGEPDIETVNAATVQARAQNCDFVIGIGGGSVIDTSKAVSALLTNGGELMDYLEVIGLGKEISKPPKPFIAIPTTAGTGSEVTRNAVINIPEDHVKVSMRSTNLLPAIALVDPELTYSMPARLTASTGMDAFIQVIEPYVSNGANSMVDMFCRDAIPRAARFLLRAYKDGADKEARDNMAWVSLMGGLSLANAKLGAVHGFSGALGGMFTAPHGLICAALETMMCSTRST